MAKGLVPTVTVVVVLFVPSITVTVVPNPPPRFAT